MNSRIGKETALQKLLLRGRAAVRSGDWTAGLRHYDQAFRLLPSSGTCADAAELMRWTGHIHRLRGDHDVAVEHYEAALAIARACGLAGHEASAHNDLGNAAQLAGEMEAAEAHYRRAGQGADAIGDPRLAAMAEQNLGVLANIRGQVDKALDHYERALDRYERAGDHLSAAWALNNIGMAQIDLERFAEAEVTLQKASEAADRSGDVSTVATIHLNLAELHLKLGAVSEAFDACDQAFVLFSNAESQIGLAEAFRMYSALHRRAGKSELAEAHLSVVARVARESRDLLLEAEAQNDRAMLHLEEGRSQAALVALNQAHELYTALEASREVADLQRRMTRLETSYLQVVRSWAESIESKDRYTDGHCQRVADLVCLLASDLGYPERDLRWIRMGALIHDVGKTSVPGEILNKPGPLTEPERELVEQHTTTGDALVAELGFPWDIRPMVRSHHERWDGQGYPDGLAGKEIPGLARVLCVVDVYDALTSERSYRAAMDHDRAMEIMEDEVGQAFDPEIFRRFRSLVRAASD